MMFFSIRRILERIHRRLGQLVGRLDLRPNCGDLGRPLVRGLDKAGVVVILGVLGLRRRIIIVAIDLGLLHRLFQLRRAPGPDRKV